ncbi:DUF4230 domain-containing protein [Neolewinella antarctica]|uniref:DUF4230 domain-containing protein n=1 Tax=Neolewinella antarctica TaxID=442734 RepID=A0ABX0XG97_9BACT|nr:DUF4230 domain-containing protein [Neolewinella antarctica]NJC27906.1 hypothetical protein [Neolewinella antarctica]
MKNFAPIIVAAILAFLLGIAVYAFYARSQEQSTVDESTVLLEQVRKVSKLVTVEGDVNELFNRTQSRNYTVYLPLPTKVSFDKQASVQVTGKILVGYDLSKMDIAIDDAAKTITLSKLPEPEILAVDHEIVYRDLNESWFNTFTAQDYSDLNKAAKQRLRDGALNSRLMDEAREQGNSVLETISFLARGAGFTVIVEGAELVD